MALKCRDQISAWLAALAWGSALTPDKFGAPFSERSDVDVIVVSEELFDHSWVDMLTNRRKPWLSLKRITRTYVNEHRERFHIYNGFIYPSLVAEALTIGESWTTTFNGLSRIPPLSSRSIGGRLYRTWEHARQYHRRGLEQVRSRILAPSD